MTMKTQLTNAQAQQSPQSEVWSPNHSIMTAPAPYIRADRVDANETPIQKAMYQGRVLDAYTIGIQAYVYGWPIVEASRIRSSMLDPKFKHYAAINTFRHEDNPADDKYRLFVSANADLLYSQSFFDLATEPVVLHVPDTKGMLYWAAQISDFFTETVANVSKRSVGNGPGNYALVGPHWQGTLPAGVVEVRMPTTVGFILLRTYFENEAALPATREIQRGFTLTPLSAFLSGKAWKPVDVAADDPRRQVPATEEELMHSLVFFQVLNRAITESGIRPQEEGLMKLFARIGISPGMTFDPATLDKATREGVTKAIEDGMKLVLIRSSSMKQSIVNGWVVGTPVDQVGAFGFDYLQRAGMAHRGIYANTSDEYMAAAAVFDSEVKPLTGAESYVIHMDKDQLPKVEAYWGLTIYELPSRYLFPNPVQRWTVNSIDKRVKYNADGSLDIYVQRASPGKEKEFNWLAAPEGQFQILFRAYRASDRKMYMGEWAPGGIKRVK